MRVARIRTPVLLAILADALRTGHRTAIVCEPTDESVSLAWAMLCLEHGVVDDSLHGVFNFNLGNHDATSSDVAGGPVFSTVPEREIIAGAEQHQVHTRPAYEDAVAGAAGYWSRLREGFADAFYLMPSGDPESFAEALKAAHYYTDAAVRYAAGLRRWQVEYDRRTRRDTDPGPAA